MRRASTVLVLLALAFAAPATLAVPAQAVTANEPGTGGGWRVTASPFTLSFRGPHGQALTGEAPGAVAGPGGRLAYQVGGPDAGSTAVDHRVTDLLTSHPVPGGRRYTVATDEPGRTAMVTVERTAQGTRVAWTLTPSDGVTAMFEALTAAGTEHYLSGSSAAYVDLRGHIRGWSPGKEGNEAGDYCQNQEQTASSFYLSSGGYGFYADTTHVGRFAFPDAVPVADGPNCGRTPNPPSGTVRREACPVSATALPDRVQICVKDSTLTYDIYAGTPQQVTTGYYRTVGLPSLPPPTQLGLTKWRDVNAGQQQVLDDLNQLRQLGIPVSTIFIDNPWEQQPAGYTTRKNGTACNGSLRFDPTAFPDPQAMIDQIHAQGVKFGLWVSPIASTPSGQSCAGLNDVWAANGWLIPGTNYIDFSNPAARQYYIDRLTDLFRLGVDMTKEDRGEEYRLDSATLSGGPGASLYLSYPDLYQSAVSAALRNVDGEDFETLVRAGAPGTAQDTHGMWGSDSYESFAGLRTELRYGISESLTGHFAWGSDTGGIDPQPPANATDSPTPSLLTRWAQFSAVSPVFEVGGAGLDATPWLYDPATVARFRDAAVLHYELFPYLYGLAEQAARTGVPILRAVGYQYPGDPRAWAQDQEFMVGPDLLAAPVTADRAEADGEAGQATPVDVYLPAGQWVDVFTGQVVAGGQHIVRDSDLDSFPLYLRAGAPIGFNARVTDQSGSARLTPPHDPDQSSGVWPDGGWGTDELTHPGLTGWLYAPGAGAATALSCATGTLRASSAGGQVQLTLNGSTPHAQILVLTSRAPSAVRANGHVLPRAADADALGSMSQGWTYTSGPFGGVVVKLAPSAGHAEVQIA